jgi:predicted metal-dependent hydrolase
LQLDVELESIERTVHRVELANEQSSQINATSGITLTSVSSAVPGTLTQVESVKGHRASSMVELIQQFTDISSAIERLSTKALTIQIDFPTTDFPRETADRLDKISRFDKCTQAIQIKDQMLYTVVKEKEENEELIRHEKALCEKYAAELSDWTELTQSLLQQLNAEKHHSAKLLERNKELIQVLREHNILYITEDDEERYEQYRDNNNNNNTNMNNTNINNSADVVTAAATTTMRNY